MTPPRENYRQDNEVGTIDGKTRLPIGVIVSVVLAVIPTIGWVYSLRAQVDTHLAVDAEKWLRQNDADQRRDTDISELKMMMKQLLDRELRQGRTP